MSESLAFQEEGSGWRFSWGLALAGGAVAVAVTFALLTLGSGVGLLFLKSGEPHTGFLTGGAIYFLTAQAFGFAVGGHIAGRLLGPLPESHWQEEVRAAVHGLVVWAVCVVATLLLIAAAGAATAALYGVSRSQAEPVRLTALNVDRLFRPGAVSTASNPAAIPPVTNPADPAQARAEAGRLIEAVVVPASAFNGDDRARLVQMVGEQAHVSTSEARLRVAAMESRLLADKQRMTDTARKTASALSLWIAFALLFGAFVAMVAAVTARLEDDHQTGWTLFAFHRGWRS